jgi:ribA/ribD-fused uncharacterized protein
MDDHEPAWFTNFRTNDILSIKEDIKQIHTDIQSIQSTANYACEQAKAATERAEQADRKIGELQYQNSLLEKNIADLRAKLSSVECQARRDNLIFSGIKESENETWQDCEQKVLDILKVVDLNDIHFERAHRIGLRSMYNIQKPRNIIAKFSSIKAREKVWLKRFDISRKTNTWINEDFPEDIKRKRQTLLPALKAAQRSPHVKHASLKLDKLIVDKKTYTVESMSTLPSYLQPDKTTVIETDNAVVFFTQPAIFSNLHPIPIVIQGQSYTCNEQYFQQQKAVLFDDQQVAEQIMRESSPYEMMKLAKTIKNYKHSVWLQHVENTLFTANQAKYSQNQSAKAALLATGNKVLGEASSNKLYGTGIGLFSKDTTDCSKWTGKNLMGKILSDIRDRLR